MKRAPANSLPSRTIALLVACCLGVAWPGGAGAAGPSEPIGHSGRWITDADGRVLMLHGVNVVAKGSPTLPADRGFGADDAAFLADHGFNTVRLGVDYAEIEPSPGSYSQDFIDAWISQLPMLADHGIYTLLDVHQDQFAKKYAGNGLPAWMAIDNGLPNTMDGFPNGYLKNPALNRAFDNFWTNTAAPDTVGLQDHYAEGLSRVAAAAADQPGLLGYDLFNEPWPGSQFPSCTQPAGCPGFDAGLLTAFSNRAIAGIRSEDLVHLAFYEPNLIFDFGALTWHGDTGDPAAGFSFHDYCLPGSFSPGTADEACQTEEDSVFNNAELQSTKTGDALLLTEFGASEDPQVFRREVRIADNHMVGWQVWTYANYYDHGQGKPQSLVYDTTKPPTGDNVDAEMLAELVRPYPRLIAGTPESWSFDRGTLEFDAAWSNTLPGGGAPGSLTSEVFVPDLQYASGYGVRIRGGEVIDGLGTQKLQIRACPDAPSVTLTVDDDLSAPPRTCAEQGGGGEPPPPGGKAVPCPPGNSPSVRCAKTTLADGKPALQVVGTGADERLAGTAGREVVVCGSGSDRVRSGGGSDRIRCGDGDDSIRAQGGRDDVFAGRGGDRVRAGVGDDTVRGDQGVDRLGGGEGDDVLRAGGGGGAISGREGHDRLAGGNGQDRIRAGRGPDLLLARGGRRDSLACGPGRDRYTRDSRDVVGRGC